MVSLLFLAARASRLLAEHGGAAPVAAGDDFFTIPASTAAYAPDELQEASGVPLARHAGNRAFVAGLRPTCPRVARLREAAGVCSLEAGMLAGVRALSETVPTPRYRGPPWRPARGRVALVAAATALFAAAGCRIENDALQPRPRAGALAVPTSEPLGAAALPSASGRGLAEPSGLFSGDGAPRGPRHDLLALSRNELWAAWNSLRGDAYALDPIDRFIDTRAHIECNSSGLVNHRGQLVPYQGAVRVDPAFRERLVRFEQVVIDVATEVYGRAPARVRHLGAYVCRPTRNRSSRMSEHALGNAIDVAGFDFARAKKQEPLAVGLPRELRGPFQIRVARHWIRRGDKPVAAVHARFLHELADRLSDRSDIFRGMIGPSRSDHSDHFHLDMSPWRYVYF